MIAVNVDVLSKKLQPLFRLASYNKVIPVLENILFEVIDNALYATASNMETELRVKISDLEKAEAVSFCIEAKSLSQMLKTLGESIITMKLVDKKGSLNGYSVLIKSDYGSYNLPSIDSAEFPIIEHGKDRKELLLPSTIVDSISEALPFMAKDELRPAITQLLLHKVKDEVKVVATDAHSLYLDTFPILSEGYGDDSYQINIPPRAASTIVSINLNAPIPVIHSNKNTLFILGDYDLTVINIQDKFPHYEAIIPEKHNFKYTFTKAQFEGAVKRAAIFNESFKLSLNEGNKNQIVAYNVETQKEMKEDLPGVSYGVLDIGMGTEYALRALSALKEKEVEMELISNNKAIVFNEGQKKVLVMPIMVP